MTGPPAPVTAGPLASATSVTVRNRVPVTTGPPASVPVGSLAPVISVTARNGVPATTGPPAPVTAGLLNPATSATAIGFSISVGYAAPIVAISFSILS